MRGDPRAFTLFEPLSLLVGYVPRLMKHLTHISPFRMLSSLCVLDVVVVRGISVGGSYTCPMDVTRWLISGET